MLGVFVGGFTVESAEAAVETVNAAVRGEMLSLESHCRTIQDVDEQCCDGATAPLVEAAEHRGIPVYRLSMDGLVQLGEGVHQRAERE